jgi:hypothetical protein
MLDRETNLSKLKKMDIIQRMQSDNNGMKLKVKNRKKMGKLRNAEVE